jgi:regulator of protease activity HflC (stomatin/prohibitin superfamily)
MFTALTVTALVALFIVWKMCVVVPMREAVVVERLGRFAGVLHPGLHLLIPFVDRVTYRQEMREQVLDIPPQSCITRDNIQVEVDGLVYLKVMDAQKASYGIENYRRAAVNLAQTTMRAEIGKLTLDNTFSERDRINENIVREIDKASDSWGIKMKRYEIRNINPSARVIDTLEKQMEAERHKRAKITLAGAERDGMINQSQGERQEAVNLSEGAKQARINEANGRAREITLLAEATARGIHQVAAAIRLPGGPTAVKMRVTEQFVDELGRILKTSKVTVVPAGLANIKGFFEGIGKVAIPGMERQAEQLVAQTIELPRTRPAAPARRRPDSDQQA